MASLGTDGRSTNFEPATSNVHRFRR